MTLEGAIAVTRFGLGARPGEIALASKDPKKWLKDQLKTQTNFPTKGLLTTKEYILEKVAFMNARRPHKDDETELMNVSKPFNKRYHASAEAEFSSRFHHATKTQSAFQERLVHFWSNHFSISGRPRDILTASSHEREAIRPFILGKFRDLGISAILHPSMLIYLDNVRSIGPNSLFGLVGRFRKKGLNENLAREVMELHTVTPAAGYSQSDVTEFSKALTGWTIAAKREPENIRGTQYFNPHWHEPGSRTVLGKTYFPIGKSQAPAIIRNLCDHPATAKNVCFKLARHFTSDTPPPSLVKRLTSNFIRTGGDLKALYIILVNAPEIWENKAQKIKTPNELLVSTACYLGSNNVFPTWSKDVYEGFGQTAFRAPSPEGWPDVNSAWVGPDALMKRIEWANIVAQRNTHINALDFITNTIGPLANKQTRNIIEQAESNQQALALALMCPEFQRR